MNRIAVLLALLSLSCNTAPPMTSAASPPISLSIATDGDISGRGIGSVSIEGDEVTTDRCRGTLTVEERDALRRLASDSHPESWKESYGEPARPDQVHYTLTLAGHTTSWHGETQPDLPKEVSALRELAWKVRGRVVAGC